MSLINQMLQDLESRRAVNGPNSGLPNDVRPLPPARRSHRALIVSVCVVMLALSGIAVWQLAVQRTTPEYPVEAPVVVLPKPPLHVAAPVLPQSPVMVMTENSVAEVGAGVGSPNATANEEEAHLRLTTSMQRLPEPEATPVPQTPQVKPLQAAVPKTRATVVEPVPVLAAAPAARTNAPVLIEKSAAAGSPHERAEGEYRKAVGLLNAGQLSEAIVGLRAALKQEAVHTASRQLLFKLLIENNRLDEAVELLRDGLQLQPAQISWAMSLGRLQLDRGDLSGAQQTLQRSLPFAASSADYQAFLAHVLQRLGRSKEAVEYYQLATRLAPAEGRWWLGLGLALQAEGRAPEAHEAFLKAKGSGSLQGELLTLVEQKLR